MARPIVEVEVILSAYRTAYAAYYPDRKVPVVSYKDGWVLVTDAERDPTGGSRIRLNKLIEWTRNLKRKATRKITEAISEPWNGYPPNRKEQAAYYLRRKEDREVKVALWIPDDEDSVTVYGNGYWLSAHHPSGIIPARAAVLYEMTGMVPDHISA